RPILSGLQENSQGPFPTARTLGDKPRYSGLITAPCLWTLIPSIICPTAEEMRDRIEFLSAWAWEPSFKLAGAEWPRFSDQAASGINLPPNVPQQHSTHAAISQIINHAFPERR